MHNVKVLSIGQTIKDQKERVATIQEDGSLSCNLFGTDIMSLATLHMIRLRRKREGYVY